MKKIIMSIFLLLTMISICILNMNIIKNISYESIEYTDKVSKLIPDASNKEISEVFEEFEEYWTQKSNILGALIYHDPVDEITEEISKLSVALRYNDKPKMSEILNIIKTKIIGISDNCQFDFKNLC